MVVILQNALVANSTMMGPLKKKNPIAQALFSRVSPNWTKTYLWPQFDTFGAPCIWCRCDLHASRRPPNPACQRLLLALPIAFLCPKDTWAMFSWRIFQKTWLNRNHVEVVHQQVECNENAYWYCDDGKWEGWSNHVNWIFLERRFHIEIWGTHSQKHIVPRDIKITARPTKYGPAAPVTMFPHLSSFLKQRKTLREHNMVLKVTEWPRGCQ